MHAHVYGTRRLSESNATEYRITWNTIEFDDRPTDRTNERTNEYSNFFMCTDEHWCLLLLIQNERKWGIEICSVRTCSITPCTYKAQSYFQKKKIEVYEKRRKRERTNVLQPKHIYTISSMQTIYTHTVQSHGEHISILNAPSIESKRVCVRVNVKRTNKRASERASQVDIWSSNFARALNYDFFGEERNKIDCMNDMRLNIEEEEWDWTKRREG